MYTISDIGSKSIITNYNGTVPLKQNCGYSLIRPIDVNQEPMVWEAGRATSAAPLYFKPMTMAAGRFIDGGLGFPNPIDITSWERRQIWPEVNEADVCLSLGTGVTTPNTDCEKQLNPIKALWSLFISFLDNYEDLLVIVYYLLVSNFYFVSAFIIRLIELSYPYVPKEAPKNLVDSLKLFYGLPISRD
ncbi:hypothetical protein TEQG_03217 [Trichophyton equinum CBS 127.97]|uniref:PNPLA domain-containing protein n=1 Tax=Trichophyton equinum (strain ATCC MYA-4606 / CBS 127.97) TaxID=559882 RepID=F2PQL7_TRIEC|nr:hypothetical protein TEQG_03217 [Trichophyton equinum CBS 127.97]